MVTFTALRRKPELVTPARPTPHEYKALSDIDDQRGLRYYPAGVEFFGARRRLTESAGDVDDDPVRIIRAALAEALVSYYPLAGRLVELPQVTGGKLLVDCTAEGVVFVEADADVRLQELGQPLAMPYPCMEELLCYDIGEPQDAVIAKPLLFFQVTRFSGNDGFAIGYRYCHSIIDGFGMAKFLYSVYALARGEVHTELPVWGRELLIARAAPHVTHKHSAYDQLPAASAAAEDVLRKTPLEHMVTRHFRFGPREMAAMRSQVPASLVQSTTVFELVTAAVWQCRTAALGYEPHQRVRLIISSNARGTWKPRSPLPQGFYGNALVLRAAEATTGELIGRPLGHAIGLLREAKSEVMDDGYMQSMLDLLARRGRPWYSQDWTYMISDATSLSRRVGAANVGRWERAGGGITTAGRVVTTSLQSYYERCKSRGGEDCAVVSMCLPAEAMEGFSQRISAWGNMSRLTGSLYGSVPSAL
ncbi:hypothetical protein GQ55_8G088700 [Panicum hallii var. hallii]|uniref:Uncharacterized protein n=1 Tax=Panicum hallii var. hallii TaxID=1504633 RepID=A0A2T7CM46_9POAL|nr:hypothetical protein GQ55_8G088700 [Panicum hallii var. hallii]